MQPIRVLRRLAEQHDYVALLDACLEAGDDPAVLTLRALAQAQLGDPDGGRALAESLDAAALDLDARVDLAAAYIALGELDRAVAELENAQSIDPGHPTLLARLAWCRWQQGQNEAALILYERSLSRQPTLAAFLAVLTLYRDSGRLAAMASALVAAERFWQDEQPAWPPEQRRLHGQRLRELRLELWLAEERFTQAEAWLEDQHKLLAEDDWCALLSGLAPRLAACNRHEQAEEWLRGGLRHYPDNLALLVQLAELAELQGRTQQSVALLRRALRSASLRQEPTAGLWIRLSRVTLRDHPRLARKAAERALDRLAAGGGEQQTPGAARESPLDALAEVALGNVEVQEQNYEAAERRFRQLVEQHPRCLPAWRGLGQLALELGEIDEAEAAFKRVMAIDPMQGHGGLIAARRFATDEQTLEELEGLARTPGAEGSVRTGLLFHLASVWEAKGDYDRAFALADEANRASRRLLRYEPSAHRQFCARIRQAFPRALFDRCRSWGRDSTLPVFVVGMPRSGTTLVEQILAGHSRIHGAGELGTIPRVVAGLNRWERHTGSGRSYPDCVDDLDATVLQGIADNVLAELRDYAPAADHVVDKLPHNFEHIGLIRLLFPTARIISVRRDPRDIAVSNFFTDYASRHGGMGFAYDLDWIGEQLADHNLLVHHWDQVLPDEILEVHYEELIDDPETTARRMLSYIGVSWEPEVLDFQALRRPVKTASLWQVRQPLYRTSKARWRRFERHLVPLIAATNRRIRWSPFSMVTLPEPGLLNRSADLFRRGELDGAERYLKVLLRHVPDHAAAQFLLGSIFLRKGYPCDGIALMEQAVERCPWNGSWRGDLAKAYRLIDREAQAAALLSEHPVATVSEEFSGASSALDLGYLHLSEEVTCSTPGSVRSDAAS